MRRPLAVSVVLAAAVGVAAALALRDDSGSGSPAVGLAASSLAEVLPRIAPDGRFSFGGSNQLAQQIRRGAPFDVFFSASPGYVQDLYREGLVVGPTVFATNELVLIVPKGNPAGIRRVQDLAGRPALRLAAASSAVPIGAYTRQALRRLGLLHVLRRTVSLEPDVKGIVGKVVLGEVDAGFVYATDVEPVAARVHAIRIPAGGQPSVSYLLATAASPAHPGAAAVLVADVLGAEGRRELQAAGFGLP